MERAIRKSGETKYPIDGLKKDLEDPRLQNVSDSESEDDGGQTNNYGESINLEELTDLENSEDAPEADRRKPRQRAKREYLQKRNEKGETPLHRACIAGNLSLVQKLIDQGHSLDVKDYSGWTPLHEACNHGYKDIVEVLIEKGANINDRGGALCDGFTPLLDAASNGCLDIVELLLNKGASPLMKTNKGETILHCLAGWRERYIEDVGGDLGPSIMPLYNSLYSRLEADLKKAGQRVPALSQSGAIKESKSQRRSSEDLTSKRQKSEDGASEYLSAMRSLKPRHNQDKILSSVEHAPQPALLMEAETVDDWLDDDLIINRHKRKRKQEFVNEPGRKTKEVKILDDSDSDSGSDDFEKGRKLSLSFTAREAKLKRSKSPPQEPAEDFLPVAVPTQKTLPKVCIRIRVEGKLLLVPVENQDTATIGDVAQEAAKRFYCLEGIEPVLRLSTEDGAFLVDTDPVSLVLSDKELHGFVLSWKKIPISERYRKACADYKSDFDSKLNGILELSETTGAASIADLFISQEKFLPFIKTLSHPSMIQTLCLQGNTLQEEDFKVVGECLGKLKTLKSLNLSRTGLTTDSLESLYRLISEHNALQSLQILDLSYNALEDSWKILGNLLNFIPSLKELKAISVDLTASCFKASHLFSLETIETIDLSFNAINGTGVYEILRRLDGQTVRGLKFAGTGTQVFREIGIFLEHHHSSSLEHLDLSYCSLSVEEEDIFAKGLRSTPNLTTVVLNGVKNASRVLNGLSLQKLSMTGVDLDDSLALSIDSLLISSNYRGKCPYSGPYNLHSSSVQLC